MNGRLLHERNNEKGKEIKRRRKLNENEMRYRVHSQFSCNRLTDVITMATKISFSELCLLQSL